MTECSSKRIKLDGGTGEEAAAATAGSSDDRSSPPSKLTTVSLGNKITLVPLLPSQPGSPLKLSTTSPSSSSSSSPAKISFIESLTKKPTVAVSSSTSPPESSTTTAAASAAKRILTITSSNGTSISPSAFASSLNGSEKIQYVKIVNSVGSQPSSAASTFPNSSLKITSVCSSSSTQEGIGNVRPLVSSTVVPGTVKSLPKTIINKPVGSSSEERVAPAEETAPGGTIHSPLKGTTTFQLVNSFPNAGSSRQAAAQNPPQRVTISSSPHKSITAGSIIHKIQPVGSSLTNYKVLSQQLPPSTSTSTSTVMIKPSGGLQQPATAGNNRIVITKTVSAVTSSDDKKPPVLSTALGKVGGSVPQTTQISLTPIANSANLNAIGKIKTSAFLTEIEKHTAAASHQMKPSVSRPTSTLVSSLNNVLSNLSTDSSSNSSQPAVQTYSLNSNPPSSSSSLTAAASGANANIRKPCNCTKSMCLKLYCDCFAMGAFCHDCNCVNCFNTLEHEDERNKAIKLVLDRNPQAFQSKIGKFTHLALNKMLPISNSSSNSNSQAAENLDTVAKKVAIEELDEIQSRHMKGCNCKKSNCLKRYCECYLAKIQCSALCKCVGCKNCDEATRSLLELANAADLRNKQLQSGQLNKSGHHQKKSVVGSNGAGQKPFGSLNISNHPRFNLVNGADFVSGVNLQKQLSIYRSYGSVFEDMIENSGLRLMSAAATASELATSNGECENEEAEAAVERRILEEFGACLVEIISKAEKRKLDSF